MTLPPPAGADGASQPGGAGQVPPHGPVDPQAALDAARASASGGDRIIDTSRKQGDGLDKCPRCGGTEIQYRIEARALECGYCRYQWNEPNAQQLFGLGTPIEQLRGHVLASATADVNRTPESSLVTIKCQGCGAEVVIKADEQLQARCHWCRQVLSVSSQIPNGAVPDALLPFLLTREQGVEAIRAFAAERRTFADATFKREFVPENVMGVYIPYMVVDGNLHAVLEGTGEITTRQYTIRRKVGEDTYVNETYYDADVYSVGRAFDLLVDDLTIESSSRYDASDNRSATNNVLDAVQPYDIPAAVAFNANYLAGFTSERRDLNVRDLDDDIEDRFLAVARQKVIPTVRGYDRGVRWEREGVAVRGSRWMTVAVPVWLYSYASSAKSSGPTHYIAVNGRNGTTMGSIPVSHPKIFAVSCCAGLVAGTIAGALGLGLIYMN